MTADMLFSWTTLLWLGAGTALACGYFFLKRVVIEFAVAFGDGGEATGVDGGGDAGAGGDGGGGGD